MHMVSETTHYSIWTAEGLAFFPFFFFRAHEWLNTDHNLRSTVQRCDLDASCRWLRGSKLCFQLLSMSFRWECPTYSWGKELIVVGRSATPQGNIEVICLAHRLNNVPIIFWPESWTREFHFFCLTGAILVISIQWIFPSQLTNTLRTNRCLRHHCHVSLLGILN